MPADPDFNRREAEIDQARLEILVLQERIKKLVTRRHVAVSEGTNSLRETKRADK